MRQKIASGWLAACLSLLCMISLSGNLQAAVLTQADIAKRFPPPFQVGAKLGEVPAWPLSNELTPDAGPVAYAFESIDLAPIPGFEGAPFNLLVAIDSQGNFMSVEVLQQHEPVFLSGLGEAPLHLFVQQYAGKNVRQRISVSNAYGQRNQSSDNDQRVVLDGVTKATASIHVVNQTVLAAALAVARARLGLSAPGGDTTPAQVKTDLYTKKDFKTLLANGEIVHQRWRNEEVEALFANTDGAGLDAEASEHPKDEFVDLYIAYLNAPTIGRALLGDSTYQTLMGQLEPGQSVYWLATTGRYPLVGPDFVRGSVPALLTLSQDKTPLEARDADLELHPPSGAPQFDSMLALVSPKLSGLNPGREVILGLDVIRDKGLIYPIRTIKTLTLSYTPPEEYFSWPPKPLPEWLLAWKSRAPELIIIGIGLLLLSTVLARPRLISIHPRRLRWFRLGFLAYTLVYIGWYAQGQLSIVQITGAIKTLVAGHDLSSFLYDPVSLLLIAFTILTFFVWGRGTFCGWLCPFGALQEFVALLARRLGIKARRLPAGLSSALERGRILILFTLIGLAGITPQLVEQGVEIEPFKTAITLGFDRSWPYVAWAIALLAVNAIYYKFFCRYLCPLGSAITLGGMLRRWNWLPRRKECGQPCQTCRSVCEYDAIARDGRILYDRCFQCLDCVGIYHDTQRCAPLIFMARKGRDFPLPKAQRRASGDPPPSTD